MPTNGLGLPCLQVLLAQRSFFVSYKVLSHNWNRNIKPEVVFKVQKVTQYATFCLIMGPFKGEVPVSARLWRVRVRVRISFTTGAVRSAILATAGLLVIISQSILKRRYSSVVLRGWLPRSSFEVCSQVFGMRWQRQVR